MAAKPATKLIDVRQLDRERVIGAWDLGGAIVDPGPESRMETLLEGLTEEPRALLLTHIHLDHAGAAGALVERFPGLEVWVHAKGAPHLVDPARLLASAQRIYGDRMGPLWGRVVPVPERNLRVLDGGETIEVAGRALAVEYTPGHASHHVVYFDDSDGTAYVGDVAGVRIPPSDLVQPPTPPPDIDVSAGCARSTWSPSGSHAFSRSRTSARGRSASASRADPGGPARAVGAGAAGARRARRHGAGDARVRGGGDAPRAGALERRDGGRAARGVAGRAALDGTAPLLAEAGAGGLMATETIELPRTGGPDSGEGGAGV